MIINGSDITIDNGITLTNGSGTSGGGIIFEGGTSQTLGVGGTGALVSGLTGGELFLYCPAISGTLTIGATIANSGATPSKFVKDGPGSAIVNASSYTGGTFIYGGSLAFISGPTITNTDGGSTFNLANASPAVTLTFNNTTNLGLSGGAIQGSGTVIITAPVGTPAMGASILRVSNPQTVALTPGSLIDVEYGSLRNDNGNTAWNNNYASAYVNANGMLDAWDGYMQVDALNGYGVISKGWSTAATFAMGAANGSGTFYGIISNNISGTNILGQVYGGAAGGVFNVTKLGTGTQVLMGTNTYVGATTVSNGTLVIGGAGTMLAVSSASSTPSTYAGLINVVNTTSIFNYASSQNLTIAGGGSGAGLFEVTGTGTLALAGGTYSCTISNATTSPLWIVGSNVTTTVSGKLYFSAVTVSNGATLGVFGTTPVWPGSVTVNDGGGLTVNFAGTAQWSPGSKLTLGNSTGCALNFAGLTNSGTGSAPFNGASITENGTMTVNVLSLGDANVNVGSVYPLMANSGSLANYTMGSQPTGWAGHLALNGTTLDFVVDKQAGAKAATGTELTLTTSWVDGTVPTSTQNAVWNSFVPSLGAGLTLNGGNLTWGSILVSGAQSDIGITGTGILTNGNITLSGVNLGFGISTVLSGNSIWTIASGLTLTAINPVLGTGSLTVAGGGTAVFDSAGRTSTTIVSNATAIFNSVIAGSSYTLYNGATLVFSNSAQNLAPSGGTFSGSGTLVITAPPGTPAVGATIFRMNNVETVGFNAGSLIDVEYGALRNDNGNSAWSGNFASAFINTNAIMDAWDGYMQVDALNGYGVISKGWSTTATFAMGAANGNGAFYGIISNNFNGGAYGGAAGGTLNITKLGTGTQILYGTNTYVGNTIIYGGTFEIGGAGMMRAAANNTTTPGNYGGTINLVSPASVFNYASSQSETNTGPVIGMGQLVVSGSGTLTLTGANTYSGNTTIGGAGSLVLAPTASSTMAGNINGTSTGILLLAGSGATTINGNLNAATVVANGGTLALVSTNAGTSGVTVNDGSKLTITAIGASQWQPASLTLGNATLSFNGVTNSGTATAPIKPASLVRNGTVTVNVNSTADPNITVGSSYPLLPGVASTNGYTLGAQPVGFIGQLSISGTTLVYTTTLEYDVWKNASGNGIWDIGTSTNWVGNGLFNTPKYTYKDGDYVLFSDSGITSNQIVTVSSVVTPAVINAVNTTYAFTLNATNGGFIAGSEGLIMNGSNTLVLLGGANTYSGVTTINAGTVAVRALTNNNVPSDLGEPNTTDPSVLVINGGTLSYWGPSVGTDRGVTVGVNNGTIAVTNVAAKLTLNGLVTGPGMLISGGSGTLVLTNGSNSQAAGTTVGAGSTVQLGAAGIAVLGPSPTNFINGTLDVNGNSLPFTNMNVAATGIPTTLVMGNNAVITNSGNTPVVFSNVFVQASSQAFTLAGNANEVVNGVNGPGYPNHTVTNRVTGTVDYTGTNGSTGLTWAQVAPGTALIDRAQGISQMQVMGGLVKLTVPGNSFYSGNTLVVDGINGTFGTFEMNGTSQLVGSLTGGTSNGVVVNTGGGVSTLILNGGATYYGTIKDGSPSSQIAVVETNTGTQNLSGTNSFTGGLTGYSTGTINYGRGEPNSQIFNYPVTFATAGSTMNFNLTGQYVWNDSTISGPGTFGENNNNMVMKLSQPLVNFTGTNHVLLGTFDLNSVNGNGPIMAGGITVDSNTNATLIVEDQNGAYPEIGGNLNLGALSTVIFNFDGSGNSYFLVDGALTANGTTITINVTNTAPLAVGHTYNLIGYGTLNGTFSSISGDNRRGSGAEFLCEYHLWRAGSSVLKVLQAYQWTHLGNGNWSVAGNWSAQPNAAGLVAFFGNSPAATYTTVTLDQSYTIGGMYFFNTNSFGIVPSGGSALTLDNSGSGVSINVTGGTSNLVSAPLVLGDSSGNTSLTASSGTLVTLSGAVSGTSTVTVGGGGTVGLAGANTFSGPITVNSGTLRLGNLSALGSALTNFCQWRRDAGFERADLTKARRLRQCDCDEQRCHGGQQFCQPGSGVSTHYSNERHSLIISGEVATSRLQTGQNPARNGQFNVTNYNTGTLDLVGTDDNVYTVFHTFSGTLLLDKINNVDVHAIDRLDEEGGLVKISQCETLPALSRRQPDQ